MTEACHQRRRRSRTGVCISRTSGTPRQGNCLGLRRRERWRGLVSGLGEKVTDASTGRAFLIGDFVPDNLIAVVAVSGGELRAATGEAKDWKTEVHVLQASVRPSVEPLSPEQRRRSTEGCRVFEERVELGEGLRVHDDSGPPQLMEITEGCSGCRETRRHGINRSPGRCGREVNGERRFGSDGTGYFDVQQTSPSGPLGSPVGLLCPGRRRWLQLWGVIFKRI